jgi:hypothetical protein
VPVPSLAASPSVLLGVVEIKMILSIRKFKLVRMTSVITKISCEFKRVKGHTEL